MCGKPLKFRGAGGRLFQVLTKADLVQRTSGDGDEEDEERVDPLEGFMTPCASDLAQKLTAETGPRYK